MRLRRPSVFAVALTLAGIAAFCALGVWQLQRANYKQAVLTQFHRAASAPLVDLAGALAHRQSDAYPHVRVTGRLDSQRIYLLDDQMRSGRLGVMVFVPFFPRGSDRVLLVNLGFLAKMGPDLTEMPDLPPVATGKIVLAGVYAPPPLPGLKLGGNPLTRQAHWPKVVTWIDTREIAADLGRSVLPHVLLLDPDPHSAYLRTWTANVMPPARHRAYAFQWFTFAVVAIVLFIILHRAKPVADARNEEE